MRSITLRVQVPNNHILTQDPYYNYYYPKPKYLIIGYMDPLGKRIMWVLCGMGGDFSASSTGQGLEKSLPARFTRIRPWPSQGGLRIRGFRGLGFRV